MIWLLRHGEAEDWPPRDDSRELTEKGRRQAENVARVLAAMGVALDACLTSPKVRARQTAEIVSRELGLEPKQVDALRKGLFDAVELAAGRNVLLVGHSRAIRWAAGGVKLRRGGLVALEDGRVRHLLTPEDLEQLAMDGSQPPGVAEEARPQGAPEDFSWSAWRARSGSVNHWKRTGFAARNVHR